MSWTKRKERRMRINYNKTRRLLVSVSEDEGFNVRMVHWPEWSAWFKAGAYRNSTWQGLD